MLRRFEARDLLDVMEIWLECNMDAHDFIDPSYWKNNYNMVKEQIPKAEIWVYDEGDHIAGFIGVIEQYVAGLFVRKTKRNQGIGTLLLDAVKEEKDKLLLAVFKKNESAIEFYKKSGFYIIEATMNKDVNEQEYNMSWSR